MEGLGFGVRHYGALGVMRLDWHKGFKLCWVLGLAAMTNSTNSTCPLTP